MKYVDERAHGVALTFPDGWEVFLEDPNLLPMRIWISRRDVLGETGHVFDLSHEQRMALWRLFTPDRAHT